MTNLMKRFVRDESGAALIEYTVLLGIMIAAVVTTIGVVGGKIDGAWTTFNTGWTP